MRLFPLQSEALKIRSSVCYSARSGASLFWDISSGLGVLRLSWWSEDDLSSSASEMLARSSSSLIWCIFVIASSLGFVPLNGFTHWFSRFRFLESHASSAFGCRLDPLRAEWSSRYCRGMFYCSISRREDRFPRANFVWSFRCDFALPDKLAGKLFC